MRSKLKYARQDDQGPGVPALLWPGILVDWLLRGPIQAFCQEPGYLALVSCLFLENPILVMLLIFLLILGGLELVRLELGDQLGKLGRKIKRWLKSHL